MIAKPRIIVLSVDRLRTQFLGCYGNTWVATPAIDRLACESLVFDEAHAAGPRLADFFETAWETPPLEPMWGRPAKFVTDDPEVARLAEGRQFAEIETLPSAEAAAPAAELEETHLASVFAAFAEHFEARREPPGLTWLHVGSLGQVWDAPRALRERYHEADDAPLPEFVAPPRKLLAADFDPDERWGYALAYAAQVSAFDACLDLLLEQLRAAADWETRTFLLCGVRGYPLGEHRRVGPVDDALYGELLHTPWLLKSPGGARGMERCTQLVTPADLGAVLQGDERSARERLEFHSGEQEFALRTREWFLRRTLTDSEPRVELYAKPDDRWEVNDVHDRCHDVVEELLAANYPSV